MATKKNAKNPDETLSMGFGFVEYKDRADAIKALRELQNATLDGHQLALKLSNQNNVRQGTVNGV